MVTKHRPPKGLMLINGEWVQSVSGEVFQSVDPSNRENLADVARGAKADIDSAVRSAREALEGPWRKVTPVERSRLLMRLVELIRENKEELAVLESLDVGRPISASRTGVEAAARYWEYYAGVADKIFGTTIPAAPGFLVYGLREPIGVCGIIIPWNGPLGVSSMDMGPALAAGNTCVLKPAEEAPLSPLRLGELALEAGIPPGVINIVTGLGEEAGASLASHPGIDHITFTGSPETGAKVMQMAAQNITPVLMELGGKSPHILFADADLDLSISTIVGAITSNCGQNCLAGSRLLVEEGIEAQVVEALAKIMADIRIGPGMEDPDMGPLVSDGQHRRVLSYLEIGKQEGARVVIGGKAPKGDKLSKGFFVEPTIFDKVDWQMRIAQEEIFGPVLSVISFKDHDIDKALEIANGTPYGLVAAVWTRDIQRAHWLADKIKAGTIYINNYGMPNGAALPFGGYKRSGFGRVHGMEALNNYTQLKTVAVRTG